MQAEREVEDTVGRILSIELEVISFSSNQPAEWSPASQADR
jgi:hypothetical protein